MDINKEKTKYLITKYGEKDVVKTLAEIIMRDGKSFPFKKYTMIEPIYYYNNLIKLELNIDHNRYELTNIINRIPFFFDIYKITYNGKYTYIKYNEENYDRIDILTDYFNEKPRVKCLGYMAKITPYNAWHTEEYLEKIIRSAINTYGYINNYSLREGIFKLKSIMAECRQSKCTVNYTLYKLFSAKNILDISSAYGDRLISAIAHDCDSYTGIDPEIELFPGYREILNTFVKNSSEKKKFKLINMPFEKVTLTENQQYDFVIWSPPNFVGEKSATDDNQAIEVFKDFESWLIDFMLYSIQKAYKYMTYESHFVITILDRPAQNYSVVELLILAIELKCRDLFYEGVIGWESYNNKKVPFFIFKKEEKDSTEKMKRVDELLKKYYGDIYRKIMKKL